MSNQQPTHRSLTGIVTKLVGDGAMYGFINDEIFFPQNHVVSGGPASVGDQVFAECEYSAHLPIKWNATSVKILNKAAIGSGQNLVPDRAQQDMMNQQQQQQFGQAPPVAVTYQQHRQQRQQRLDTDSRPHTDNKLLSQHHRQQTSMNEPPTTRLLDQNQADFFGPPGMGAPGAFPQHNQPQQDAGIAPFQEQPIEAANFTFTSQPGSAFVQNQFLPPPFLPQQAAPLLPQSQHLLPQNNQPPNNLNQRNNKPNRFNNTDNKNDRQQNRNRNQNRNSDNKFDRMRSGDREGQADRSKNNNNNNNSNNSRDRSTGRGGKRDGPSRPSPPSHSSARSTSSSDKVVKSSRRHYEPQNIPKTKIMTDMNAYNMKQRCPSSIHVPSDLKDIIVNKHFRLDIKNIPKPLRFIIEEAESGKTMAKKDEPSKVVSEDKIIDSGDDQQIEKKPDAEVLDSTSTSKLEDESGKTEIKGQEQSTPPSSKSDIKLNHKYGVKVILISVPEFDAIYRKVFGPNLDSFTSDNKLRSRLDEAICLLCNKGTNNGHSLIGGKFDPVLDGFVEGKSNRFERHERLPDLIATCKRVVLEQTGLDLGPCRSWNLLSTFLYNNKSDYFSPKASVEYSFIYMPQIWTMLKENLEANICNQVDPVPQVCSDSASMEEQVNSATQLEIPQDTTIDSGDLQEGIEKEKQEEEESSDQVMSEETEEVEEEKKEEEELEKDEEKEEAEVPRPATQESSLETPSSSFDKSNIYEMKRDDLKLELDKRSIKYKLSAKKAELLELLEEALKQEGHDPGSLSRPADGLSADELAGDGAQLEEGEVVENDPSEDSESRELEPEADPEVAPEPLKRRAEDEVESESKRLCTESDVDQDKLVNKSQRVELISEAFFVKSREEQQLSLVSLHEAAQVARHDQFELSVASNILKESLVQHLSEYILTALVEDNQQTSSMNPPSGSSSQNQHESTTSSDTNNNTPKSTLSKDLKSNTKEYPVDRYINLAFSYFDSTQVGYIFSDDLIKLFNNTDLTISKRALTSLLGDSEKFNYRTLADLSPKLPATYIYEFPEQFKQLPDGSSDAETGFASKTIEYKGVVYDLERLTQEVKDAETLRVSMVDRFNYAIENSDKQAEEIHVLEVNQKSLSRAIKTQNDEICDLKRERDSIKKKYEALRKGIKGSIGSLSDLIKEEK